MPIKFLNDVAVDSSVLYVDTINDRVGIGTTNPSRELDVDGNIKMTETAAATDTDKFVVLDSGVLKYRTGSQVVSDLPIDTRYVKKAGDTMTGTLYITRSGTGQIVANNRANFGTHYTNTDVWIYGGTGDTIFLGGGIGNIQNDVNVGNGDFIVQNGDVGIGTTSPGKKLHVSSNDQSTARIRLSNTNTSSGGDDIDLVAGIHNVGQDGFSIYNATSSQTQFVIRGSGNVGIGTTGPNHKLEVIGTARFTDRLYTNASATNTVGILGKASANGWASRYDSNNSNFSGFYFDGNDQSIILGRNSSGSIVNYIHANASSYFNGGNVGIGTTSPQEKLHVQNYTTGESHQAMFKGGAVAVGDYSYVSLNNGYSTEYNKEVRLAAVSELSNSNKTGFAILTSPDSSGASGHERLRVTADGNVGIGTDSPGAKLEVDSNDAFRTVQLTGTTPAIYFNEDDSASTDNWHLGINGGILYFLRDTDKSGAYNNIAAYFSGNNLISEGNFYAKGNTFSFGASTSEGEYISRSGNDIRFIAGGGTRMSVDGDNGNVGIGDTSPDAKLTVFRADSTYAINLSDTESRAGLSVKSSSNFDSKLTISSGASSRQYIQAVNNAATTGRDIVINPYGGNVGIGTDSPTSRLHVQQTIASSSVPMVYFEADRESYAYGATNIRVDNLEYGSGMKFYRSAIYDSNAISFINGSSTVGSITISTSSTSYNTSSDYRLKENVTSITDGITRIKQLKPKRFNFIGQTDVVDGFLAHEAQDVVPESVTGNKDEVLPNGDPLYQGIDQAKIVPLLTAALQEAITKIEDLENRIQVLENK